jgi:hypothetical protein
MGGISGSVGYLSATSARRTSDNTGCRGTPVTKQFKKVTLIIRRHGPPCGDFGTGAKTPKTLT